MDALLNPRDQLSSELSFAAPSSDQSDQIISTNSNLQDNRDDHLMGSKKGKKKATNSSTDQIMESSLSFGTSSTTSSSEKDQPMMNLIKTTSKAMAREKKVKKARFAFQTRSQVDILDDGYRWRKYGQKAVKNNNFPRSYYRCTHQGCDVKKQVQRLSRDEGIVVTTYEGVHSHPIQQPSDNFEHILHQLQIYSTF